MWLNPDASMDSQMTVTELENKFSEGQAQIQHLESTVTSTREEMKRSMETALQQAEDKARC